MVNMREKERACVCGGVWGWGGGGGGLVIVLAAYRKQKSAETGMVVKI